MRILINGDIGGSGGYVGYCRGVFGSGVWPDDLEATFACSVEFAWKVGRLDPAIAVVPHGWPGSRHRVLRYLWHLLLYPRLVRQCRPALEFYPSGTLRDFMRRPRCVTVCHNLLPFADAEVNRYVGRTREYWLRFRERQGRMFERSSGVIFLSEHSRETVLRQFPRIRDTVVIPHGVDDAFRRDAPRSYDLGESVRILYVSPVYHYKHQVELVEAIALLRKRSGADLQLRLVGGGGGEDAEYLGRVIDRCNGRHFVTHLPFLGGDEVRRELAEADIFAFASSCETFGITLLEAMAARLPIACSDRSGLPRILKTGGLYFDPERPESIADALQSLIERPAVRQECGEVAYQNSLEYSWARSAKETIGYLKKVASY